MSELEMHAGSETVIEARNPRIVVEHTPCTFFLFLAMRFCNTSSILAVQEILQDERERVFNRESFHSRDN